AGGAALVYGDTGVALAVAGPGILGALVLASHDASYREEAARTLDGYARHAPLVRLHALAALGAGLVVAGWAGGTLVHALTRGELDGEPARQMTAGTL